MSKIGKKYTLSTATKSRVQIALADFYNEYLNEDLSRTKSRKKSLQEIQKGSKTHRGEEKETQDKTKKISLEEKYVNQRGRYEGKIVFDGPILFLKRLEEEYQRTVIGKAEDVKFSVDTHRDSIQELKDKNTADKVNILSSRTKLEYNFLVKNYERYLDANPGVSETALPYFYDVLTQFVVSDGYLGFEGTTFFETPQNIITSKKRDEFKTNIVPTSVVVENQKLRTDKHLEKFNIYKEQFPFYTDITFDTHELDEKSIFEALSSRNLTSDIFRHTVGAQDSRSTPTPETKLKIENDGRSVNVFEFDIQKTLTQLLNSAAQADFTFIFDVNQRIDSKARTFLEILSGQDEYSEVIGYHLKKYEGNTNNLVQEWVLPNFGEGNLSWVDSQIKYDKTYTYKLDLIVLTFETSYEINSLDIEDSKLVLRFNNTPRLKVYTLRDVESAQRTFGASKETLGSTYTNKLLDFPPMPPEIEIVPLIGVDNKIKLNLNTAVGSTIAPFLTFSPSEQIRIRELQLAQDIFDPASQLLAYQSDEPSDFMEVYRLEERPKSYNDFFNKRLARLTTNNAAGAAIYDDIQPNKKYYYIARSVDYHENISNPTPVYEVEIISDRGVVIPTMGLVEFDNDDDAKQLTRSLRKLLKIQPAARHREANAEKTNYSNIELGEEKLSPWNKRFKLRLTSKSSGKKIDVNFTFKYNKP